jgi:hypothetical protein
MAAEVATLDILLSGETELFVHRAPEPTTHVDATYRLTNWALRISYARPDAHLRPSIVPLAAIFSVAKTGGRKRAGWYGVTLHLAPGSSVRIACSARGNGRPKLITAIRNAMARPLRFPTSIWNSTLDWYDRLAELSRWDVFRNDLCESYPPRLLGPPGIGLAVLEGCARYRTRNRLPFLSYVCPENQAPLVRASQPKTGITNSGSSADQQFFTAMAGGRKLAILDCRPKLNAFVNQFTGGGYERSDSYTECSFIFLGIPNIHRVRECYQEMIEAFQQQKPGGYESWGALTRQLIHAAILGVQKLHANEATLVHCTDGWDRTAQVCGLIQVIMDPFCRTLEGFRQLIQKEWCDAGHMFSLRCGHTRAHADQCAPIFGQFIDAVEQLRTAAPAAFEFTEKLLGFLLFHSYARLYGDFDGNCRRDRAVARAPSLWMAVRDDRVRDHFVNPYFVVNPGDLTTEIPVYQPSNIIYSSPLFACGPDLVLLPDPSPMDPAWCVPDD